jgi:very-short-patch-repair endonuclease
MVSASQHADTKVAAADDVRTGKLDALGWTVLCFWNDGVLTDIDGFCAHIVAAAQGPMSGSTLAKEAHR